MKLCLLWIIAKGVAVIFAFKPGKWEYNDESMVWIDGRSRPRPNEIYYVQRFYDRIVSIYYLKSGRSGNRRFKHESTGVFISTSQILTTFNPYRELSMNRGNLRQMRVTISFLRSIVKAQLKKYIHVDIRKVVCARQIIPESGDKIPPIDLRHGVNSPLHDLMVLRLDRGAYFFDYKIWTINPTVKVDLSSYAKTLCRNGYGSCNWIGSSPRLTKLARIGEKLSEKVMSLVSIGHLNDEHIFENRYLERTELTHEEKIIADCDEWLPREWGYFICLRNLWKFEGIASGAMLFSNGTLFGIGAFAIWKGNYDDKHDLNVNNGILVFTDVRPYQTLLTKTCTKPDQRLKIPRK